MRVTALGYAAAAAITLAGCAAGTNPKVDTKAEEQAIRALDEQWSTVTQKRDVEGGISFYAADGVAAWPDAPAAQAQQALRAAWTEMFKIPGLWLRFVPQTITISDAGDMATDFGVVDVEMDTPKGRVKDTEKYLVVWKKVDGKWKVLYDMYNTNHPAEPAAAVAAAAAAATASPPTAPASKK